MIINTIVPVLPELLGRASILIFLLVVLLALFVLTFARNPRIKRLFLSPELETIIKARYFLGFLVTIALTTFAYWVIDLWFFDLPNKIVPYIFILLMVVIIFGLRLSIITLMLIFILIDYYLYPPPYSFNPFRHPINSISVLGGLVAGLTTGYLFRLSQKRYTKSTQELEMLIKAREQFTSSLVHDLKNPLSTIRLYAEIIESKYNNRQPSQALHSSLDTIRNETDKLLEMINDLLEFSKLREGKYPLTLKAVDMVKLINDKTETTKTLFPNHIFNFSHRLRKAYVWADQLSVDRIFTNLLTNAAKYSPEKSRIDIILNKHNGYIVTRIKDQGVGMDLKTLKNIFEPFFQGSSKSAGLGLGLFITSELVRLNKGKIQVDSKLGRGSTFTVSLPAYRREGR